MTTSATDVPAGQEPAPAAKKRGRETAGDMIRSLGLVMALVVALWFFAQPPASDEAAIRPVDPAPDVAAWTAGVPGAPVLDALPEGWVPTSSRYGRGPERLSIGHVTPAEQYAEFAASTAPAEVFVPELTGEAARTGTVDVRGVAWDAYAEGDGSLSLVRRFGDVTVVVGSLRSNASLEEISVLAAAVRTGG